ncbi:MAG: CpsB/CapC family capsule biosynthesis tyrosine phosphatase, partial [Lachnospiraceae bacterium]
EQGYEMDIYTGNEIYYHEEVPDLLEAGKILTLASSSYVLVEFSPLDDFRYIRNSLAEIQAVGFNPIIAHVERYENICKKPFDRVEELRDMGVLIQVNASTVEGKMGRKPAKAVRYLLKNRMVDFLGTDAHSNGNRAPYIEKCMEILEKKCPAGYVDKLLYKNAEELILQ